MHAQPLICVRDVEASSRWYQHLLGCQSGHGGPNYERLVRDGILVLQLHRWDVEDHHGRIGDPNVKAGNGVLLWFELEDVEDAYRRAGELGAEVVLPLYHHAGATQMEFWLRDSDGYTVVLSTPDNVPT